MNRLLGLSAAKSKISRQIGIPLTRSGRQRKLGRMMMGGGCLLPIIAAFAVLICTVAAIADGLK